MAPAFLRSYRPLAFLLGVAKDQPTVGLGLLGAPAVTAAIAVMPLHAPLMPGQQGQAAGLPIRFLLAGMRPLPLFPLAQLLGVARAPLAAHRGPRDHP